MNDDDDEDDDSYCLNTNSFFGNLIASLYLI